MHKISVDYIHRVKLQVNNNFQMNVINYILSDHINDVTYDTNLCSVYLQNESKLLQAI